jgi:hypothetical protein
MALLVERDALVMPVDSIASALRYVWIFVWETHKLRVRQSDPPDRRVVAKMMRSYRKDNLESPKKWARERHAILLGDEYGAHGYPRLDARQRGKLLYREYANSKGAKTKRVDRPDGKRVQVIWPTENTFVDYVRLFQRESAKVSTA